MIDCKESGNFALARITTSKVFCFGIGTNFQYSKELYGTMSL